MQGQAFLVTFAAIGKSDWPRAAMEREAGMQSKVAIPHHQTLRCAQGERGGNPTFGDYATTLSPGLRRGRL